MDGLDASDSAASVHQFVLGLLSNAGRTSRWEGNQSGNEAMRELLRRPGRTSTRQVFCCGRKLLDGRYSGGNLALSVLRYGHIRPKDPQRARMVRAARHPHRVSSSPDASVLRAARKSSSPSARESTVPM